MKCLHKTGTVRLLQAITLLLAMMISAFAPAAFGQDTTATVEGTVADPTQARVPAAKITLTEKTKNQVIYSGNADTAGHFLIPQVPPGSYSLSAEAKGFSQTILTDITVTIGATITLDVLLKPGSTDVSVSVNASAQELLEKATSGISTLITPSEVDDLPMPNRDVTSLLEIVPGVSYGGDSTSPANYQLSINGSRTLGTEVLLDGVSVIENVTGQILPLPSPDALGQLRFSTLNAPAEYGRTSGAVLSAVSKSGANDYHFRLYELFRHADLNANTYFNKLNGIVRPTNTYNQYGAVITGPVRIPKLYDGRDKTFFMVNFDQTLHVVPQTIFESVIPNAFRNGDFSSSPSTPIFDPLTGQQFPNNIIPASRLDPAAQAIIALLPQATGAGSSNSTISSANNFVQPVTYKSPSARYALRLDQAIGSRARFYGMGERFFDPKPQAVIFSPLLNPNLGYAHGNGWVASIGYTHIWTANIVSDIRYGYNLSYFVNKPTGTASSLAALESELHIATLPINVAPSIQVSGYSNMGPNAGAGAFPIANNSLTYNLSPSVTVVHGHHAYKAGFEIRWDLYNNYAPSSYPNGEYTFDGDITSPTGSATQGPNAAADFLLGAVKTAQYEVPSPAAGRRNQNYGIFAQDDWRMTSKLTMNIGLRYEYETPVYINNNNYSRLDATTGNLLVANMNANKYLNLVTPRLDLMPRIGFAYAATNKLVLRGAFGTFYAGIMGDLDGGNDFLGYDGSAAFSNLGTGKAQPFVLSQGMPLAATVNLKDPFQIMQNASYINPVGNGLSLYSIGSLTSIPHIEQRNLGFQYQLPYAVVIDMNYTGSHGLHLPYLINSNNPALSQATAVAYANNYQVTQQAAPIPSMQANRPFYYFVADSNYNALQTTMRRQFGKQLSFVANYTWAHSIDDQSTLFNFSTPNGGVSGQYPANPLLRRMDRSGSSFDVRNNVNITMQVGSVSRHRLLDGWKLAPVFVARGGLPLNISQTTEFPGAQTQRPLGTVRGLKVTPKVVGNVVQYLQSPSTAGFPLSPSGPIFVGSAPNRVQVVPTVLGNVGRYPIQSPGEENVNASLSRTFKLPERSTLQLRVDAFNVLNHTNFTGPATALTVQTSGSGATAAAFFANNNFGQVTNTYSPRFLQLQARFTY